MAAGASSVALAFGLNIGLCLVVFVAFSILRSRGWCKRFYAPKRFDSKLVYKPKRLPPGLFAWMGTIFQYPETELIQVAGLDSAMYVRVLQFGWEVFLKVSILVLVIILPINATGGQITFIIDQQSQSPPPPSPPPPAVCGPAPGGSVQAKQYSFSNFDLLSVSNIHAGSPRLWAHCVALYVITYIVLKTLSDYNYEATLLRLAFLGNQPKGGPSHTVLITDIPGIRYGTIVWYLRKFVGSTLFIMLPQRIKQKILNAVEEGVHKMTSMDVTKAVAHKTDDPVQEEKEDGPPKPMIRDAYTKTAEINSKVADEAEMMKAKRAAGELNLRRRKAADIVASDPTLNPWYQAGQALGDPYNPEADKVKGFIHNEIEFSYGNRTVAAVNPVWDVDKLMPLVDEFEATKTQLEDHVDQLASLVKRRKKIKPGKLTMSVTPQLLGTWGMDRYGLQPVTVDKIIHWTDRLRFLYDMIVVVQKECLTKAIPTAFVTLELRATQTALCSSLYHHDESTWAIQLAPEPKEIIWGNLGMRTWERGLRSLVLWVGYVLLVLFFLIPITAVQALIQVPRLASIPVLGTIVNLPVIRQLLEAIVPGLVLLIFLALLPTLLAFMCRLAGMVSLSQVDFGVVTRYFWFQFVSVFIGSIVAGSVFNQLQQLIQNPSSIIQILGIAVPMTASFFINYILVTGIGQLGIKHLRLPGLVIFWLLSKIAATPRARARLWADQYTQYGGTVAYHTMTFLMGLAYCVINPIMAPVCLIYFSFAIISERYNNLYVFKRTYESGGRLWVPVFNQFVICVYVMQVFLIVLLAIKKFPLVVILIPAPCITFIYHIVTLNMYLRPWTVISAHDASQLDKNDADEKGDDEMAAEELQQIQDMYLAPCFKVNKEALDDLLVEADVTRRRVNGESMDDIEAHLEDLGYVSCDDDEDGDVTPPLSDETFAPHSPGEALSKAASGSVDLKKPLVKDDHSTSSTVTVQVAAANSKGA